MSKTFGNVWCESLIYKLKQNGMEDTLLALFQNYLSNRKQRTTMNGFASHWGYIKSGVPQGSVLGLLHFLVYMNELEIGIKSGVKILLMTLPFLRPFVDLFFLLNIHLVIC